MFGVWVRCWQIQPDDVLEVPLTIPSKHRAFGLCGENDYRHLPLGILVGAIDNAPENLNGLLAVAGLSCPA
jgi:hypothetical protein